MDELVQHCLRELSFDGDLGCNISRLGDFITAFYSNNDIPQSVDDSFCSFVWPLVVQHSTVRVGTLPQGVSTEVWVAPQTSAKRKAIAKGQQHVETTPSELDLVADAHSWTLKDLKQAYGERLRIALHPDAIYAAITGSHIRFPKLSPMVYSALQIITKGREEGVTVVDLGQQSKYDQKTCFYLVRQLVELDLVVKVRRGGIGTHFVIHKFFFETSPCWKAIRDEENLARNLIADHISIAQMPPDFTAEDDDSDSGILYPKFTPIDSRHLSSFDLICARVKKLLKASKNQMHASQNLLITLGFSNPTKTDRRFFQSRIREMIQQGIIEKVVVPSNKKGPNASVKCFRLVPVHQSDKLDPDVQAEDDDKDGDQPSVKINITLHKQVFDLLEEAGINGMTLNELSASLSNFDKRTIELLLSRAEKFPPPVHLSDLGVAGLMETRGRERRHRYFTIAAYQELMQKENLDTSLPVLFPEPNEVAGFLKVDSDLFFDNEDMLFKYQDSFTVTESSVKPGMRREVREERSGKELSKGRRMVNEADGVSLAESSENDRPLKRKKIQDKVTENIPKKRGRPRKKKKNDAPINSSLMVNKSPNLHLLETAETESSLTPLSELQICDSNLSLDAPALRAHIAHSASEDLPITPIPGNPRDSRLNVSHLRRENEFFRVVQNMGGVVNIHTKDFFDAHSTLVDMMAKAGEPTSGPIGIRTDKRTAISTFDSLERRGRVKQLKTTISTPTGIRRAACIAYLPTIDQERLNNFLVELSRNHVVPRKGNFVKLGECLEYRADPNSMPRSVLPLQLLQMEEPGDDRKERWSKNMARARQLFSYEDPVVREVLLTERTTVAQLYGFIIGKALRTRELHLSAMDAFEKQDPSPYIISYEQRVVDLTYFCHDIPVGLYCSIVSSLSHSEELTRFMALEERRMTLLKNLPTNLKLSLQIGRSRSRSRILDLLETLRALKVVVPLEKSSSESPFITCNSSEGTNTFDLASLDGWTIGTPMTAPVYWLFKDCAPIHIWATSETSPPFWKNAPLASITDAVSYWKLLEQASLFPQDIILSDTRSSVSPSASEISAARSFRRHVSWNPEYTLTWHQMQYMKQFFDPNTAETPLQTDERDELLEKIAWVISAPHASVQSFFEDLRKKTLKDLDRIRKRRKRDPLAGKMRLKNSKKASLAMKAAETQSDREEKRRTLVTRIHPLPFPGLAAARVDRVRDRFLGRKPLRRHRFQWNREYDELARDASVIIRARCRNLSRLDWTAFEQVFPAVPRNTVRQRLAHIKETPGNEAYLIRLEDRWHELWLQHRGTPCLPDEDPKSTSNFNLLAHIEFLRKRIDKNAIRVGFSQPRKDNGISIFSSVDELLGQFNILENVSPAPPWDFVWNTVVEEGREKRMLRSPFLRAADLDLSFGKACPEHISLAECAVKMTLGTPHDRYKPEVGAALLHSVGERYVSIATKNLLNKNVLSKLIRDPEKQRPGRQLKISEGNQNAVGGPLPKDTFQDALSLEDITLQTDGWREWPLLATDGDCATLVELVSEDKLEFKIDTSQPQFARAALDWNSKKAGDDQIETAIYIRAKAFENSFPQLSEDSSSSTPRCVISSLPSEPISLCVPPSCPPGHGRCLDGGPACCRFTGLPDLKSKRIVERNPFSFKTDCTACLEGEWVSFNDSLALDERDHSKQVLDIVRNAGKKGVSKAILLADLSNKMTKRQLWIIVKKMTDNTIPLLFWAGYCSVVLVSSAFLKHWTIVVSHNPTMRIFPRRWLDIAGCKVTDYWDAALKAVLGVVIFRPGITQAELRWRLRSVYDRQELCDVIKWLHDNGYLKLRCSGSTKESFVGISALNEEEDKYAFWFLSDERRWYQV